MNKILLAVNRSDSGMMNNTDENYIVVQIILSAFTN